MYRAPPTAVRLAIAFGCMSLPGHALGPEGAAIDSSNYTIDFHQGLVLQGARVMGLAGSLAPLAEGVVGYSDNPATAALRVPWSRSWYDWEVDATLGRPSRLRAGDYDNNGAPDRNDAAGFAMLGVGFQFGNMALGLHVDVNEFELRPRGADADGRAIGLDQTRIGLVAALLTLDGQLALGAGLGANELEMSFPGEVEDTVVATVLGPLLKLGAVWAPLGLPLRAGVSARVGLPMAPDQGVDAVMADANGDYIAEGYYVPRQLNPPTVLQAAVATQFFRELNGPWMRPPRRGHDPKPAHLTRDTRRGHLQLIAGLKVTLPLHDAVGMESFLRQEVARSGRRTTFSPSIGAEGEPWSDVLILRGGSYLEPSRFENGEPRWHVTAGTDIHIPIAWSVFGLLDDNTTFRVGGALDRAPRYLGWAASLGVWH